METLEFFVERKPPIKIDFIVDYFIDEGIKFKGISSANPLNKSNLFNRLLFSHVTWR